jgi:hypothetical protein
VTVPTRLFLSLGAGVQSSTVLLLAAPRQHHLRHRGRRTPLEVLRPRHGYRS